MADTLLHLVVLLCVPPFLQGVLVKTKARFAEYGLAPAFGARHIGSGPGFVTKDNIAKVEKYAGQYR